MQKERNGVAVCDVMGIMAYFQTIIMYGYSSRLYAVPITIVGRLVLLEYQ